MRWKKKARPCAKCAGSKTTTWSRGGQEGRGWCWCWCWGDGSGGRGGNLLLLLPQPPPSKHALQLPRQLGVVLLRRLQQLSLQLQDILQLCNVTHGLGGKGGRGAWAQGRGGSMPGLLWLVLGALGRLAVPAVGVAPWPRGPSRARVPCRQVPGVVLLLGRWGLVVAVAWGRAVGGAGRRGPGGTMGRPGRCLRWAGSWRGATVPGRRALSHQWRSTVHASIGLQWGLRLWWGLRAWRHGPRALGPQPGHRFHQRAREQKLQRLMTITERSQQRHALLRRPP
jgi:hypothetical protein